MKIPTFSAEFVSFYKLSRELILYYIFDMHAAMQIKDTKLIKNAVRKP